MPFIVFNKLRKLNLFKSLIYAVITEIGIIVLANMLFDPITPADNRYFVYLSFFIATLFLGIVFSYRFRNYDNHLFAISIAAAVVLFAFMTGQLEPHPKKVYPTQTVYGVKEPTGEEPYWTYVTETDLQNDLYMILLFWLGCFSFFYLEIEEFKIDEDNKAAVDWVRREHGEIEARAFADQGLFHQKDDIELKNK